PRLAVADGHERVQRAVVPLDARERVLDEIDRRDLTARDERRELGDGVSMERRAHPLDVPCATDRFNRSTSRACGPRPVGAFHHVGRSRFPGVAHTIMSRSGACSGRRRARSPRRSRPSLRRFTTIAMADRDQRGIRRALSWTRQPWLVAFAAVMFIVGTFAGVWSRARFEERHTPEPRLATTRASGGAP